MKVDKVADMKVDKVVDMEVDLVVGKIANRVVQLQLLSPLNSPHCKINQPGQKPRHRVTPQLHTSLPARHRASSGQQTLQPAGRLERKPPQRLNRMCKPRPEKMGDKVFGISSHVSFIDHLDIGLSLGVVILLLLIFAGMCTCRKGICLKTILGKHWFHLRNHQTPTTTTSQQPPSTSTAINMVATAPASSHVLDSLDEELAILQKRNQLIELQNRRTQLMEQAPMSFNPGNKYPVM